METPNPTLSLPFSLRREWLLRLLVIPVVTLVVSHVFGIRRLPWQENYQFPLVYFFSFSLIMLLVWEMNWRLFGLLDRHYPFQANPWRRIRRQVFVGLVATAGVFSIVFTLLSIAMGGTVHWFSFGFHLIICLTVASIINGIYVGIYLLNLISMEKQQGQQTQAPDLLPVKATEPAGEEYLLIDSGQRQIQFKTEEIACIQSVGGMVVVIKMDGQRITTNYNAFTALSHQLSGKYFFQVSRQLIVHRQAIRTVEDGENRKRYLQLIPLSGRRYEEKITISRYRSQAFQEWFRSPTTH